MTVFKHELRQGKISLIIWTAAIAVLLAACVLIYPQMSGQMDEVNKVFSSMGGFTVAFGMDKLNFGELMGFYGIECGNVLGLGGALFAALTGISALAKEEKEHTAEFLLSHPVSRIRIISEKLCAVVAQILILNLAVFFVSVLSVMIIGETVEWNTLLLLHLAYLFMQLETALICFGISAFLRRSGLGIGLGLAAVFYFMNIIANLTDDARFLKYITPFGYTESADIITDMSLDAVMLAFGAVYAVCGCAAGYIRYSKKDIS